MSDQRGLDLEEIKATYDQYEREGRSSIWNRSNVGYMRLLTERDAVLLDLIRASTAGLESPRLLDLGCGTGALAELLHLAQPSLSVTGIDLLEKRIDAARERVPSATFRVGSADQMDEADATYDVIAAITLFSSLPTVELEVAVATELARVLRPGGWLIWYDIRYRNPWNRAVHGLGERRIATLFAGWQRELRSFSLLPPVARRLGRLAPVLYPSLHAVRPLRSHLIGRAQKP